MKPALPDDAARLGVGLSWRPEFAPFVDRLAGRLDFLEIIVDEWGGNLVQPRGREVLGNLPCVLHSAVCSLGSEPASVDNVRMLRRLSSELSPLWVSEHISYSRAGEFEINNFMPVQFSEQSARKLASHARALASSLGNCPLALENTCYFFEHPGNVLEEERFLMTLARSEVPIVLDINNLYVNAINFKTDPMRFLEKIASTCHVAYLHVAGHRESSGWLLDSHDEQVSDPVWELALEALRTTTAEGIVIERDHNSATEDEILEEVERARFIWNKGRPCQ